MPSTNIDKEDSQLVADLHVLANRSPKLVRASKYVAPAVPEMLIDSWKMNEFKYYTIPSPFPTLARGLFTTEISEKGSESRYRIVARGYDKFFSVGEVPWTTWDALESLTKPPYTLTLKSNGCIIFIAALTPTKLLITSKHSLGALENVPESHAQAGERWLEYHLNAASKTKEELAQVLWGNRWTAVAELCDDSFEEHVLPYSPEKTGLHLHGINESCKRFKTMPQPAVDRFAKEWGFIPTPSMTLETIHEVKAFTEEISRTGKWRGEALEGFVVRTTVTDPQDKRKDSIYTPYEFGSSFFFKVKFDEPYMMYRDWREITKALLSSKSTLDEAKIPTSKLKRPETKLYVKWIKEQIRQDRKQFDGFTKGKGIVATRERFLSWLTTEEGGKQKRDTDKASKNEIFTANNEGEEFGKTVIVPVAVPGIGKTTISVALAHLFRFGHTQSDDVRAKKAAPMFLKNVVKLLEIYDVVIADKNNHLRRHREQLRDAVLKMEPPVRLLALHWALDQPLSTIHRICGDRVLARGDNHQSLRADRDAKTHEDVIWSFLSDAEELTEGEVDAVIEMDITEPLEDALERAINGCVQILGIPKPSRERIGEALAVARDYVPDTSQVKRANEKKAAKPPPTPRYFGLLAEVDLEDALGRFLDETEEKRGGDVPEKIREFWTQLKASDRITKRPHVTIVHSNNLPEDIKIWEHCMTIDRLDIPPLFRLRLGHIVSSGRIMAATVEDLQVDNTEEDESELGSELVSILREDIRKRLHITVGTKDGSVPPIEAKIMVEDWRQGNSGGVNVVSLDSDEVVVKGRIKGLIH